ncbi:hypothetical protein NUV26_13615 [Burkholderia pseudomultivorans]|uniref:DUF4148 domain-containing protein n=1 Tax=Burkholderia aenigmatica TaxID=2015348 RepID=A0A228HLR2_9BURK|nr:MULTISPECIES: hypothetical protein [Burkholderia cepacia complex]MBR8142736.1 hypothetical protein [Burkholderia vietnamiensis]MBU9439595.1 hypothetical protein [Burkholderia multivorans]MBU9565007.1 hypothetical protein [Burkholderia multivorans]MBU9680816.1 hypothetical protein [Burkholderia multivorans]MCA8318341.1 hypothetical protein [Burkholderia multivorans]
MRLTIAALLSAAASLPALSHATTTTPDPTDAAASVPAVSVPSVFDGYRPYSDADNPTWQQLNQAVQDKPVKGGMKHDGTPDKPSGNNHSNHSMHGESTK